MHPNSFARSAAPTARRCWKRLPFIAYQRDLPEHAWICSRGPIGHSTTHGGWPNRYKLLPEICPLCWWTFRTPLHKRRKRMKRKAYEEALTELQVELCTLQDWVKEKGLRVVVVFEGRDAAGKGGMIKAITERVSPRVFRVVALPIPSDREKTQL